MAFPTEMAAPTSTAIAQIMLAMEAAAIVAPTIVRPTDLEQKVIDALRTRCETGNSYHFIRMDVDDTNTPQVVFARQDGKEVSARIRQGTNGTSLNNTFILSASIAGEGPTTSSDRIMCDMMSSTIEQVLYGPQQ